MFSGRRLKYILQAVLSKHNYIWKTTHATKRQTSQILLETFYTVEYLLYSILSTLKCTIIHWKMGFAIIIINVTVACKGIAV